VRLHDTLAICCSLGRMIENTTLSTPALAPVRHDAKDHRGPRQALVAGAGSWKPRLAARVLEVGEWS
jgi:hypothetical protein